MFIVIITLYPLAKKYKDNYLNLIAPILLIFFIGLKYTYNLNIYSSQSTTNLFGLGGLYRGFIFIIIGNLIYNFTQKIKKVNFTNVGRYFITFVEVLIYVFLIVCMSFMLNIGEIIVTILFIISIMLSFSNQSYTFNIFNNKIFKHLSKFGFILYLNHYYVRSFLILNNHVYRYRKTLIIYLSISILISIIMFFIVPIIIKITKKAKKKLGRILIKNI